MATPQVAAIIGSGTIPYTRGILPTSQRGNEPLGEGVRVGQQVMVGNPEDLLAVDAFAVSGVSIGPVPVKIWGPELNSLPRQRSVRLHNQGPGPVFIGPTSTSVIAPSGFEIMAPTVAGSTVELPLLLNVSIWARCSVAGGASITILAY